jgi:hypothetical protein
MKALGMVCPQYWQNPQVKENILHHLSMIKLHYVHSWLLKTKDMHA